MKTKLILLLLVVIALAITAAAIFVAKQQIRPRRKSMRRNSRANAPLRNTTMLARKRVSFSCPIRAATSSAISRSSQSARPRRRPLRLPHRDPRRVTSHFSAAVPELPGTVQDALYAPCSSRGGSPGRRPDRNHQTGEHAANNASASREDSYGRHGDCVME
jgi:hypothetical protein